jgi:alpha-L-fucosidase
VLNESPYPAGSLPEDAVQRLIEVAHAWNKPVNLKRPGENWDFQYNVSQNLTFMRTATQSSTHPFIRDKRAYPRVDIAIDGVIVEGKEQ